MNTTPPPGLALDEDWNWASAWPAPAKLNLFLHVVGRRPDGYHLLQTVFRFLDRADTLHFSPREDGDIRLLTPLPGVPPENDLTVRAARLLQQQVPDGRCPGADIRLEKRLPLGGGLGGGSSDAATVLIALNHLWGVGLSRSQLEALGLGLGADVPVFIRGQSVFAEGVGERFTPVTLPEAWYVVLIPPVAVPTVSIFTAPELRRDTPPLDPGAWQPGQGGNDLEPVACARYPRVAEYLTWLGQQVHAQKSALAPARMSGSGASVFAGFSSRGAAEAVLGRLPPGWQGWVAKGVDEHPLAKVLSAPRLRQR